MPSKVFISYRREDTRYQARMIYTALCDVIARDDVFMDIDSIPLGANFRKILKDWVDQCEVLLALIGPDWIDSADPQTGRRRLDNPSDFVRIEIGEALARDIPVVPIMLDGAPTPNPEHLPDDLKELADRQAEFVDFRTFDADVARLISRLGLAPSGASAAADHDQAGIDAPQPAADRAASERSSPDAAIERVSANLISQIIAIVGQREKTYYAPHIPARLLDAARESFPIDESERVFVLFDDTTMGNGRNGLAICASGLIVKSAFDDPIRISWDEMLSYPIENSWYLGHISIAGQRIPLGLRGEDAIVFLNALRNAMLHAPDGGQGSSR